MAATCLDQRRPSPVTETHGMWRLTIRVPLPGPRDLYIGAATGRYWCWALTRWTVAIPPLCISLPRVSGPTKRPSVSLHRWCAHMNVTYEEAA